MEKNMQPGTETRVTRVRRGSVMYCAGLDECHINVLVVESRHMHIAGYFKPISKQ